MSQLPIHELLPQIAQACQTSGQLILQASPGAGKSTVVPLFLLQQLSGSGRIIMLEPRRLAARNIALYLAQQLGEPVGQQVGYRVRGEQKTSKATRLEIVTEGILTRMLQHDPELSGIDLLIFDEFHERSLQADTALAFALESQAALRPDLKILVMSATLEGLPLQQLLPEAALLSCPGRAYPISYHYRPVNRQQPLVPQWGSVVLDAVQNENGSLLVFLPGAGEIDRLAEWLQLRLPAEIAVLPLYGRLPFAEQQRAILPCTAGKRKIVLTTNVAETSLTIEGIHVVIDSGLERRSSFDLKSGVTRLETRQIAKASATQRAGRAGRLGPGVCYRLWNEEQQDRLDEQSPAEILRSDLASLLLEAALWGSAPEDLLLLDKPPAPALAAGRQLLQWLDVFDEQNHLTAKGRQLALLPCEPRMGHLLSGAKVLEQQGHQGLLAAACYLVALQEERVLGNDPVSVQLQRLSHSLRPAAQRWWQRMQGDGALPACPVAETDILAAMAWPDRIARKSGELRYQLANGQRADLVPDHPCQGKEWLVAVSLQQTDQGLRIFTAEPLDITTLEKTEPQLFREETYLGWDSKEERVRAEKQFRLGAIVLKRQPLTDLSAEQKAQCLLEGIRVHGLSCLPWNTDSEQWLQRWRCAAEWLPELALPAADDVTLLAGLEQWLLPHLDGLSRLEELKRLSLLTILRGCLSWPQQQKLDELLPVYFTAPTGSRIALRYEAGRSPVLAVRIQEMFGQSETPKVANGKVALQIELLSPAKRPLQITQDLVAFWQGAYSEVKKEGKGRYPKHYWPDDPLQAMPTKTVKRLM
ncbi:ATP-dependent helicase HrpB [Tolumonas auensis]|uniref:ATP-dependent helicase HrpB n=1 Tax=Tolumonas auensis TaxID=43948 RepID=UPI002AA74EB1|nr:ATP-dependent helicase HrpB [Tolumonas auensis]